MNYTIKLENDKLLEIPEFFKFCINNVGNDIVLNIEHEGHCLTFTGVYDILDQFNFNSVTINSFNILEHHSKYNILTKNWNYWLSNIKGYGLEFDYSWNTDKLFGCLYGRPTAARLGIASHLAKNYKDKSYIKTKFDFESEDTRKLFDIQRLFSWDKDAVDSIYLLKDPEFISSYGYTKGEWSTSNELSHSYKNFMIDIIVEASCKGRAFYPTEKLTRAILCKRPFIIMANRDYLIYLRQMGFKTFYEYWDEDYDGYDGKERYLRILKLIDSICNDTNIQQSYFKMSDILEHNYNLIVKQQYKKSITCVDE
jgi:hypothetical protein